MIDTEFVRHMARYNTWQNQSIFSAAHRLTDTERRAARGAFFGSIHGTLSHLLWGDTIWMSRFDAWQKPAVGIPDSPHWIGDWADLQMRRIEADRRIQSWADRLTTRGLSGELSWYSGALNKDVTKPMAICVVHFFNHQTHHRGQVHAMLTAAGERPGDTDLFIMPEDA